MAAWSYWTEEAEQEAGVPAAEPAQMNELDSGSAQAEERMTSQDPNRCESIGES